jgi:hypothetical protein
VQQQYSDAQYAFDRLLAVVSVPVALIPFLKRRHDANLAGLFRLYTHSSNPDPKLTLRAVVSVMLIDPLVSLACQWHQQHLLPLNQPTQLIASCMSCHVQRCRTALLR